MAEPLNLATAAETFDIDPALTDDDQGLFLPMEDNGIIPPHAEIDDATATAITASLAEASQQCFSPVVGDEYTPNTDPIVHAAPFSKPNRNERTPYPEHLLFPARAKFEIWLSGESSWCHYVQRRTTTPEKRAEERMRARLKAHERALAGKFCILPLSYRLNLSTDDSISQVMSPEEAASVPPLKKRRRNRTSPILEKITYTCHHAGSYESKHSTSLPQAKLRLNTKKSVKCNCNSRIVLTEMQDGECRAAYFWKHQGHG